MTQLAADILFQTHDVFGKQVRITKQYWQKIIEVKHQELTVSIEEVVTTVSAPDSVYRSVQDSHIKLFYRGINHHTLVIVVKYLPNIAFVVTAYETSKVKRKGERLWPIQK